MNAIKSILLATLLAPPLPLAAQAPATDSFMSGVRLKELCFADTTDNPVSSTFVCVGYIMGVVDTLASLKAWDQAECLLALPRDLGTIAMTETVKGYLRRQNDAELAKRRAADVVRGAVIADWSCPKKP
jgi:Ssp1 endopeptidase immunity protein Rap1a